MTLFGTQTADTLDGSAEVDAVVGLSGDDIIEGSTGDDVIHGDFEPGNLLQDTGDAQSFAHYGDRSEERRVWKKSI